MPASMARRAALLAGLPPLRGVAPLVLLLLGWQLAAPRQSPYFPPPLTWWTSLETLIRNGKLFPALAATVVTFALGLAIACALGGATGLVIGVSRPVRRALGPLLEFCRGLPPPVVVPVAVLLLGYAESLKLLVVVWVAMWPIVLNVAAAAERVDPLLREVSRSFRLTPFASLRKIVAPSVIPPFLVGVRVAVPLAIIITLLVEMMTMLPGIGSLIVTAQRDYRSAEVYGLLVLVGLLGFGLNISFVVIEDMLLRRFPPRAHRQQ
jgi:ABC-type nitrate/sulfonate/bicarbonate transport system permease component